MFIGQERVCNELNLLLLEVMDGNHFNILLRAASGQGKTTLALNFLYQSGWTKTGEYILCSNNTSINPQKTIHILDEVHLIENPEFLYPYMDSKKHTFIFCTNLSGELKEPLRNRCIELVFDPYTDKEIKKIVHQILRGVDEWILDKIVENSKATPRIAKTLASRLSIIFKYNGLPQGTEELDNLLLNNLGISGGLNKNDINYLDVLRRVGRASLTTLSILTGLDRTTIQSEIEPFLLISGLIKITSRGREIAT